MAPVTPTKAPTPRTPRKGRSEVSQRIAARRVKGEFSSAKNNDLITRVPQRAAPPMPEGKTVIAIDPGGTTGLAVRYPDGSWMTVSLTTPSELWDFFLERPDEVVFEIFSTGGRVDRWMIYTIELVGGIKSAIYALNLHGFAHSPSKRYPYLGQAEAMLRGQSHTVHEVDALAHLLTHEGRTK